ncbi:hypothetical protein DSO57_1018410 [Entomophthora muscae]|uniref:Uncharacterized protein n=1 Tax=Entomophthora muscae TaxID=34485 RepID=A0ACC2STE1_9FUNG|nr:hypothetical protein DSO57_1018410 [Entomophthora muscae]
MLQIPALKLKSSTKRPPGGVLALPPHPRGVACTQATERRGGLDEREGGGGGLRHLGPGRRARHNNKHIPNTGETNSHFTNPNAVAPKQRNHQATSPPAAQKKTSRSPPSHSSESQPPPPPSPKPREQDNNPASGGKKRKTTWIRGRG